MNTEVLRGKRSIYGLLAEFADEEHLLEAATRVRSLGFRYVEAYSPYPIHGMAEVLGIRGVRLPLIVLAGGIIGLVIALVMQWYSAVIDYPLNVGGRPLASWPSFMPIAFELTILVAGISAVLGMFALNGLPQPYHPLFNVPEFAKASRAGFFLSVEARDAKFDLAETRSMLAELGATGIYEVMP
jgi:hypothetical protein